MSEDQAKGTAQPQASETQEPAAKVELDAETYTALLDRLDELEGRAKPQGDGDGDEVDDLARQAQPQKSQQQQGQGVDLSRMNNDQLARFIAQELSSDIINPMLVKLSQIELKMEEKELSEQYSDFKEYKKEVYKTLHKNNSLSLEQAYHLAKSQNKGAKPEKSDEGKETRSDKKETTAKSDLLRHLPKRPATFGERPSGAAAGATKPAMPKDIRSAADRAIEDLAIEFPIKGGNI